MALLEVAGSTRPAGAAHHTLEAHPASRELGPAVRRGRMMERNDTTEQRSSRGWERRQAPAGRRRRSATDVGTRRRVQHWPVAQARVLGRSMGKAERRC